ncbi:Mitochondrial ribosome-associated GTPase 2 [Orchesella cincta]|uniref:Mitochondrial ribosome-associated GTPase 2 n=1 Tax=Orchesella cincta TaxID=48709 RepID=A0A1D2NJA4_ORCCI|nr:Mitochondrial ribosome-associated GTPase 2 [Orchesella cincta]
MFDKISHVDDVDGLLKKKNFGVDDFSPVVSKRRQYFVLSRKRWIIGLSGSDAPKTSKMDAGMGLLLYFHKFSVSSGSSGLILRQLTSCLSKSLCSAQIPQPVLKKKDVGTVNMVGEFVDRRRVTVQGGKGGDGCVAFTKLWANEFAGPDGGDGGNGGHVMFKASFDVKSLALLTPTIKGHPGENGGGSNCHGKNGEHLVVDVPLGTMFKDDETGEVIADLMSPEASVFIAARGGSGGRGNKFFATPGNQSPEIAEFGAEGETIKYIVEMATIAQFGLVGYPNAGKSTLLRAITRARPKVASYPFTTLRPHVGMVFYDDLEQIAVADIPGVIEDAHRNRGLGIQFLRHIQRCVCLLYVIDLSTSNPTPFEILETLKEEIRHYDATMLNRPSMIVANKLDLPEAKANFQDFKSSVGDSMPIIPVSAKFGFNLKDLLIELRKIYDTKQAKEKTVAVEKYEPVRTQQQRKQWRRPPPSTQTQS